MLRLIGWWSKAVAFMIEPSRFVCTICAGKVADAAVCGTCGVTACPSCTHDDVCPYCGEPM